MAQEPLREPDEMTELGTTGLRRSGGFVIDEYINSLRGSRGHRTYREMAENDPVIGSILFAILFPLDKAVVVRSSAFLKLLLFSEFWEA